MKYLIVSLAIFFNLSVSAVEVDSLIVITQSKVDYKEKYDAYGRLSSYYLKRDLDSAKYFIKQFLRLAEVHKDQDFLKKAYELNAEVAEKETHYDEAIKLYLKLEKIYRGEKDTLNVSEILKKIGKVYSEKQELGNAVQYYLKSTELKEKVSDYKGMASVYNGIGSLYYAAENYKEALSYFKNSLTIADSLNMQFAIGILTMNIANIYAEIDSTDLKVVDHSLDSLPQAKELAKAYYEKSLEIAEGMNDLARMARVYSNLGSVDSVNAIEYFKKSLKLRKELGDIKGQWYNLKNIAATYYNEKDFINAKSYAEEALDLAVDNKMLNKETKSYIQLSDIYKNLKNYELAYTLLGAYVDLKDTLDKAKNMSDFAELEKKWNYEKREKENELLKKESELDEERIAKQRIYLWASGAGFVLFAFLIFFILRGYRQKQKANLLLSAQKERIEEANEELNQQNEEIASQRDEIEKQRDLVTEQKDHIEEIHQEVSESIDYAKRLQAAILPKHDLLKKSLSDFFVLFMPKDKVSGDYYWWTEVEEQTVITAADCTGHGVPGAFMSMLGVSFLKEIVNKEYITQPALILKKLRKEIIKTLDQKGLAGEQKDGMDMALVSYNKNTKVVQFAGANNPLYIISKNDLSDQLPEAKIFDEEIDVKLFELKPDKMPIAIYEKMDAFVNNEIQLQEGDQLYMFSDGYADQFGGPKGKKFKYKPFKRLLLNNSHKPMSEQMIILKQAFEDWRGSEEQIDDVVVIGLRA